jgi:hypothetical protein
MGLQPVSRGGSSGDLISVMGEAPFDIVGDPWALDGFFWFWFFKGVWGLFVKGHHGLGV